MQRLATQVQHERCLFYLATRADPYGSVTRALASAGLVGVRSSIVVEKPIGLDLESARAIDDVVSEHFAENQIYRIDHYLGKETVQNLLVLRFANSHLREPVEPPLHRPHPDHHRRVRRRGQAGHLLRPSRRTAGHGSEPPAAAAVHDGHGAASRPERDAVRDEKVKVLKSLRPLDNNVIPEKIVRGQYQRAGGESGYLEDIEAEDSATETFAALKVEIDNWRWAGVPFYPAHWQAPGGTGL